MAGTIILRFNSAGILDEEVNVSVNTGAGGSFNLIERFKTVRQGQNETEIAQFGAGLVQSILFIQAWNLDHSNFGGSNNILASSTSEADEIALTLVDNSWTFDSVTGTALNSTNVTLVSLNNDAVLPPYNAVRLPYSEYVPDRCNFVYANFEVTGGSGFYDVYTEEGSLVEANATSPIDVLVRRGLPERVVFIDSNLGTIVDKINIRPPAKILPEQIAVGVVNFSSGATLTAVVDTSVNNFPLTYSLDNVTFQPENVFTGIAPGTYSFYVRDVFGCVTEKQNIVIDSVTNVTETVFTISDINALRYARIDNNKRNHKNTLSHCEIKQLSYPFYHRFIEEDIVPTQFKTNAQYINVFTIDADGNKNTITPVAETSNIGIEAKTTCTLFNIGEGRSAVYFGAVDVLDFTTNAVIGSTDFGFSLPEWANKEGNVVEISGIGQIEVSAIGYSDFYDAFIIELDYTYTGAPSQRNLSAIYNVQPYEVYQFNTFMASESEMFNIVIEAGSGANNIEFTYISEKLKRVVDSDKLIEVIYSDPRNKGNMVYQTGIKHKLRLEGYWDYKGSQDTEGYDGDTDFFVTDNTVYDSQKFTFVRLSSEMAHKLRLVVTHEILEINNLFYKLSEVPEIKTDPNNNYKTFSVILKRSGDQFLTDEQEIIDNTAENDSIAAGIEASRGKSMLLWTKNNG